MPSLLLPSPFHVHRVLLSLVLFPDSWIPLLGLGGGGLPYPPSARLTPQEAGARVQIGLVPLRAFEFLHHDHLQGHCCPFGNLDSPSEISAKPDAYIPLSFTPCSFLLFFFSPALNFCGVAIHSTKLYNMLTMCSTLLSIRGTEKSKTCNSVCLLELYSSQG